MTSPTSSELMCLVCRSSLEISSSINIFYTSLPRSGELLASFVLGTIRPSVTDLQSSYLCPQCYNLFQMLEQAQCTVTNIQNEILKTYASNDTSHLKKNEIQQEEISAIDNHVYSTPQPQDFGRFNHEDHLTGTNNIPPDESQRDSQSSLNLPEIPNNLRTNGFSLIEESPKDNRNLEDKEKLKKPVRKSLEKSPKYSCSICDKKWKTPGELKTHIVSHSSIRPYMCEKCGQAYKHKHALKVHIGMHNGINPFKCSFCDKCFTQKGALRRHLPMHTGEMPYQCDLCGKRFIHHTSYNMHVLSHTGKKIVSMSHLQCNIAIYISFETSHESSHWRKAFQL
uniref:ZNF77 protein n=1 Tax=Fopius arisanus TaxID=64838 RepID=A0A0C9Q0E5_9HYME